MTDNRPLCVKCQRSMELVRFAKVKYGEDEAQNGDQFECPVCHNQIIADFGEKYRDTHPDKFDYVRKC